MLPGWDELSALTLILLLLFGRSFFLKLSEALIVHPVGIRKIQQFLDFALQGVYLVFQHRAVQTVPIFFSLHKVCVCLSDSGATRKVQD